MTIPFSRHTLAIVASLCAGVCVSVSAQTVPNIGDVLRQVPNGATPVERPAPVLPQVDSRTPIEAPMQALPDGGATVEVRDFQIVGSREISATTLKALLAGDIGKRLTLPQLEDVATKLTRYYRSQGYFVARVYVPQQEVKDGVVTLRAVEGNYGKFILDNKSLVRDDIVQGMLDDVKKYDIVSLDTLERAMLIINDTPGVQVIRADVMPGQAVGTSDFGVGTQATAEYEGYVLADNYGTKATGPERISANLDWNSPTRRGDRLSVSGLSSFNGDLLNARVGYSTVLSASGWRGEASMAHTQYSLGDTYNALDAKGRADSVELGVTYPIRRIRAQTIQWGLNYAYKDLLDEVHSTNTSTPKIANSLTTNVLVRDERTLLGFDGVTQANAALTVGELDIEDATARGLDQAANGAKTQGDYSYLNVSVGRVSVLPNNFNLSATLKSQRALGRNLDGSERMGLAGSGGVMAYPSGELSGSDADLMRLELSRPLPAWGGLNSQWSVLVNWGQARETTLQNMRELSDIALGWVAKGSNGLLVKAYLAHRLGNPAVSETDTVDRFLIQAGWVF